MNNQLAVLNDYFNLADMGSNLEQMLINSILLLIMVLILSLVYVKTSNSLSNRKRLAATFPLLSLTTMMIIGVIKSSLALSLGLVGALSIVRFRAAIKEPEELAYIFLAIGLGLGMGASQQAITLAFFVIVMAFVLIRSLLQGRLKLLDLKTDRSMYLDLATKNLDLDQIISILDQYCHYLELKRVDDRDDKQQFLFLFKTDDYQSLKQIKQRLKDQDSKADLSIVNDERLFS
jgi:uncharacterized membrane protein YhiD involved in acid resistance